MTPKAHTLFQPSISVPKYSTCLIAGMDWSASFQACPVGHEQLFSVISPGVSVLHVSDDILQMWPHFDSVIDWQIACQIRFQRSGWMLGN